MAQQNINYGAAPNDGTGDLYRNAMIKVQNNFTDLYTNKVDKAATIALTGGATGTATALAGATVVIPITGLNMGSATAGTLAVARGGTGVTTSTGTGSTVLSASPTFTGTPLTTTAAAGTNTTQVASMAAVQAAVSGTLGKTITGGAVTLTAAEVSNNMILFTGALTSNAVITFPNVQRTWAIGNSTTGAFTVTIKGTTAATEELVRGERRSYLIDSAGGMYKADDYTRPVAEGGTGTTTSTGTGSTVLSASPALTGIPTVPTAATATSTTQAASTAFVQAVNSADTGSSATSVALKTARSFSVAGGATAAAQSFNGTADVVLTVTDLDVSKATAGTLAVARGGTGVTTSTGTGSTVLSASPALTGTPTVPTAATATNTTQAASTAFVQAVNSADTGSSATSVALKTARSFSVAGGATAAAQSFNGTADVVLTVTDLDVSKATAGTLAVARGGTGVTTSTGTGSTVLSASPALTGTPTVPTAATATNTTQAASTAFVQAVNSADTGSSATSVALKTARSFSVAGGATAAAQSFNGTADVVLTVTDLDVSKATAGTLAVARGGTGTTTSTGTGSVVLSANAALTGNPTATTQVVADNSTRLATTAHVKLLVNQTFTAVPATNQGPVVYVTTPHFRTFIWDGTKYVRAPWHMPGVLFFSHAPAASVTHGIQVRADVTYSKADYPDLAEILGVSGSNFVLPEGRARVLRASDNGRGIDAALVNGYLQEDAIRNISGIVAQITTNATVFENNASNGAFYNVDPFYKYSNVEANSVGNSPNAYPRTIGFDASRQVPTAAENRVKSLSATLYITK